MAGRKVETKIKGATVPLEWGDPEGMITPFAFNMTVQTIEDIFKISFYEVKPPIRIDESTPPPSKVRADCVANVLVTPDRLSKFIEVLQKHLDKYRLQKQTG